MADTSVVRDVLVPVASGYAVLAGAVLYASRHPEERAQETWAGWPARLRLIAVTVGGGYLCFLGIVLLFHVAIARQHGAFTSALHGGTFLALVCAFTFLLGSLLESLAR